MQQLVDLHSHSEFSPDSEASVQALCAQAQQKPLAVYAITDHCECDVYEADGYEKRLQGAFEAVCAVKQQVPFTLLNGVELGQPLQNLQVAEQVARQPYDIILGSLHRVSGGPDYYFYDYRNLTQRQIRDLLLDYYRELYQTVQWGNFDTLAHLTYPMRYILDQSKVNIPVEELMEAVEKVLVEVIKQQKAVEINVRKIDLMQKNILPDRRFLSLYRDLGGELITIGSDAHCVDDVGRGVQKGIAFAKEIGFTTLAYFEKRQLQTIEIV